VIGHSDNSPIKTEAFPNNQALSEKRAQSVADYLAGKGVLASRVTVEGKGDADPVADNKTAAGKAKNRRVEIIVTQ
jgi:type VI secretion system protein ImpK